MIVVRSGQRPFNGAVVRGIDIHAVIRICPAGRIGDRDVVGTGYLDPVILVEGTFGLGNGTVGTRGYLDTYAVGGAGVAVHIAYVDVLNVGQMHPDLAVEYLETGYVRPVGRYPEHLFIPVDPAKIRTSGSVPDKVDGLFHQDILIVGPCPDPNSVTRVRGIHTFLDAAVISPPAIINCDRFT